MEAKDLMIGDWVQVPSLIDNVEQYDAWCTVRQLRDCDLDVVGFKELKYDEIVPIPLTPEILEKNGFVANKHVYPYPYYEYENEKGKLKIGFAFPQGNKTSYKEPWVCIDSEYVFIEHIPCIYVHQLQHTLRLCGIEKEIIL